MIKNLELNEQKLRYLYLRDLALGKIQGPPTGYASIDKPWLKNYPEQLIMLERKKYNKIVDLLQDVWQDANEIMINYYDEEITRKVFFENIDKVAKSLKELGYKKGDFLPISLEDTPEFLYLLLAAEKIGVCIKNKLGDIDGIISTINSTNSKYFFAYDYLNSEDIKLIYDKTNIEKIVTISPYECFSNKNNIQELRKNITREISKRYNGSKSNDKRNISWESFCNIGNNYKGSLYEKSDKNTKLFTAYTSGSTGEPKELYHSSESFLGIIQQMALFPSHEKDKQRDTWLLPILPPTLVAVVVAMMCYPLADGKKLILDPFCNADDLDLEIMYYEPTCCGFGPLFFSYLMASKRIPEDYDMSYIKLIGFGAEPMLKKFINEMSEFLQKHNCKAPFSSGYGNSEGGSDLTVALGKEILLTGSSGIPLIDTTISIFEMGTDKELRYNEIGEICKNGPGIMLGYKDKDLTNKTLKIHNDGKLWLHTGDYGYMTKDGLLFVLGREAIKINNSDKVFASPIENKVLEINEIHDAIVVSGDNFDNEGYQVVNLFLVPNQDVNLDELKNTIYQKLNQVLLPKEMPKRVYFLKEKPISKGLKTDRKRLQEEYELKKVRKLQK